MTTPSARYVQDVRQEAAQVHRQEQEGAWPKALWPHEATPPGSAVPAVSTHWRGPEWGSYGSSLLDPSPGAVGLWCE